MSSPTPISLSNGRFAIAWSYNTNGLGAFEVQTAIVQANGEIEGGITTIGEAAHDRLITVLPNGGYVLSYRKLGEEVKDKLEYFGPDGASTGIFDSAAVSPKAIAALSNGILLSVATTSLGTGTAITAYLSARMGSARPSQLRSSTAWAARFRSLSLRTAMPSSFGKRAMH